MERSQPFLLRCTHGRLALELRLLPAGQDWQLLLTGGDAHIGAVILAEPANAMPPDVPEATSVRTAGRRSHSYYPTVAGHSYRKESAGFLDDSPPAYRMR